MLFRLSASVVGGASAIVPSVSKGESAFHSSQHNRLTRAIFFYISFYKNIIKINEKLDTVDRKMVVKF
jgi:hypothetical protein